MMLDQLQADLASAQKARDQVKIDTLRFLLGAVFNFQIEKYPPSKGGTLTDKDVLSVIAKQVKTHKESIEMFKSAKRDDLVAKEEAELAILETYLPAQMGKEDVRKKVEEIKGQNPGADFGTLMRLVMAELRGKADGALVSRLVKETAG